MAKRVFLISVFTEALSALSAILNDLAEFEGAREMIEAALPSVRNCPESESLVASELIGGQALENRDLQVCAELFLHLTESYVGIASSCPMDSSERVRNLRTAEANAERSYEGKFPSSQVSG